MPLGCANTAIGERRRVRRTAREKFIMARAQRVSRRRRRYEVLAILHPPGWWRELEGGRGRYWAASDKCSKPFNTYFSTHGRKTGNRRERADAPSRLPSRPVVFRGCCKRAAAQGEQYRRRPLTQDTRTSFITDWKGNGTIDGMPCK